LGRNYIKNLNGLVSKGTEHYRLKNSEIIHTALMSPTGGSRWYSGGAVDLL